MEFARSGKTSMILSIAKELNLNSKFETNEKTGITYYTPNDKERYMILEEFHNDNDKLCACVCCLIHNDRKPDDCRCRKCRSNT